MIVTIKMLYRKGYRYIICLIFFSLNFLSGAYSLNLSGRKDMGESVCLCMGGIDISKGLNIVDILFFTTPFIIAIYVFSDFVRDDFIINSTYVFTRMPKRNKWLIKTTLRLMLCAATLILLLNIVLLIIGCFFGFSLKFNSTTIFAFLFTFILTGLSCFVCVYFQNMLSLRLGSSISSFITMFLYVFSLVISSFLYGKEAACQFIIKLFVPVNQMYLIHTDRVKNISVADFPAINAFPVAFPSAFLP